MKAVVLHQVASSFFKQKPGRDIRLSAKAGQSPLGPVNSRGSVLTASFKLYIEKLSFLDRIRL